MEATPAETPLKVCPHCSVASRTDAETCPSCGKPYARRRPSPGSWWLAIPIVVGAFLIGYFGISELVEDEPEGISQEEASAVKTGISRSELIDELGEDPVVEQKRGQDGVCLSYPITDPPPRVWQFCFLGDKLASTAPLPG